MNTTSQLAEGFRTAIEHPARGVVGLVKDLLKLCQEHGLQLDWQADSCRVRSVANGVEEVLPTPLRRSVFRAILARVAALCNEREPNTVSPYGGQDQFSFGINPATQFAVSFANAPNEQWLKVRPLLDSPIEGEIERQ